MKRVLKKGGKLVVWDMEAVEESLRTIDDKIENMRVAIIKFLLFQCLF